MTKANWGQVWGNRRGIEIWSIRSYEESDDLFHRRPKLCFAGPGELDETPEIVCESESGRSIRPRWSLSIYNLKHDGWISVRRERDESGEHLLIGYVRVRRSADDA